jgi:alkylhydroperoxidase family enzyme
MARIPYADPTADPDIARLGEQIKNERGGKLLNLYRMLLHSPPVARGWLNLFTAIRQQMVLPGRYRELAILRVAVLNGADYEFAQHVPFALKEGCVAEQVDAVRVGSSSPAFDARDRAVLSYAEAMTRDLRVADPVFQQVRELFLEREVVELTATIAAYNLVSRFLVAMAIDHE